MPVKAILEIVLYVAIAVGLWFAADWVAFKPRRDAAHAAALAETYRVERDTLDTSLKTAKAELANAEETRRIVAELQEANHELERKAADAAAVAARLRKRVCPVLTQAVQGGNSGAASGDRPGSAEAQPGDSGDGFAVQLRDEYIAIKQFANTCDALNDKLDSIYARQK